MKGITTCEDCEIFITIYRFTGRHGFFSVPKKWCEECDLLVAMVKKTILDLGIKKKTNLIIRPWFLWWWQPFFAHFAWHAPILVINGKLINQGIVPKKETIVEALTNHRIVTKVTELGKV